jgi:hypothetical protein
MTDTNKKIELWVPEMAADYANGMIQWFVRSKEMSYDSEYNMNYRYLTTDGKVMFAIDGELDDFYFNSERDAFIKRKEYLTGCKVDVDYNLTTEPVRSMPLFED